VLVTENVQEGAFYIGSMLAFGSVIGTCSDGIHLNPQTFYSRGGSVIPYPLFV